MCSRSCASVHSHEFTGLTCARVRSWRSWWVGAEEESVRCSVRCSMCISVCCYVFLQAHTCTCTNSHTHGQSLARTQARAHARAPARSILGSVCAHACWRLYVHVHAGTCRPTQQKGGSRQHCIGKMLIMRSESVCPRTHTGIKKYERVAILLIPMRTAPP